MPMAPPPVLANIQIRPVKSAQIDSSNEPQYSAARLVIINLLGPGDHHPPIMR
jgi:hypothetical protein